MDDKGLIIFIKNPVKGKVKTRIAQDGGDDAALKIYLALLNITRSIAIKVDAQKYLYYSDDVDHDDEWTSQHFTKIKQDGGDLGEKIHDAFKSILLKHEKVIIIGSDCVNLTHEIVNDAFARLEDCDVVIGPTFDGGYYLLGIKKINPLLFTDMPWSSDKVFDETVRRSIQNADSVYALEKLNDIDYLADWEKYGK